jgi:hypothetical protein
MSESKVVIPKDVAEEEFNRWLECNYLDDNWDELVEDGKRDAEIDKSRIMKFIMTGDIVIDEDGLLTFTPVRSKDRSPVSFRDPDGRTLAVTDKMPEHKIVAKMNEALCDFTGKPKAYFLKMKRNPDYKICLSIITIFLA